MATVNPTIARLGDNTVRFRFVLTNVDFDGAPIGKNHADFADRNVQVYGTLGGASITVQGGNDGTNWYTLDDPQGVDLVLSAAGGKSISEVPALTRPFLSGGAGSSVTVDIVCRRSRSGVGV